MACRLCKVPYAINITGLETAFQNDGTVKKIATALYSIACKKAKIVFFENVGNRDIFIDNKIVDMEKTHVLSGAGVNTHFGGAYLHAYGAGVDFIKLIDNNLKGNENKSIIGEYEEGVVMMMYDSVVIKKQDELAE